MSQFVETPTRAFTAGAAIVEYLRVGLTSSKLAVAAALVPGIGTIEKEAFAVDEVVAVRMWSAQGTRKMVASAAITADAAVYGAAGGKITSVSNTNAIGIALEAASGDNSIIEVLVSGVGATSSASAQADDEPIGFGDAEDAQIMWSTADASNHTLVISLGASQALHFTDVGALATDWTLSGDTNPTLYIHSNTTPATDYLKIGAHDGSASWGADMIGGATINFGFDGLEALILSETASAVNEFTIANAATGNNPALSATGGDANVGLDVTPKGTGDVNLTSGHVTLGDGGTVTQATNKSTGVTLNTESGQITLNGAALAAGVEVSFTVTCDKVDAQDVVIVNHGSAGTAGSYLVQAHAIASGSFAIMVSNVTAGSLSEAIVLNFAIIGGSAT